MRLLESRWQNLGWNKRSSMLYFRRMPKRCMDLRLSKQDVYLMYLDPLLLRNEYFFLYGPTGTLANVRFPRFRLLQDHVITHIYNSLSRITRLNASSESRPHFLHGSSKRQSTGIWSPQPQRRFLVSVCLRIAHLFTVQVAIRSSRENSPVRVSGIPSRTHLNRRKRLHRNKSVPLVQRPTMRWSCPTAAPMTIRIPPQTNL